MKGITQASFTRATLKAALDRMARTLKQYA
jgi:hypothetical protein